MLDLSRNLFRDTPRIALCRALISQTAERRRRCFAGEGFFRILIFQFIEREAQPREETLVMISPPAGVPTLVQPPSAAGVPKSADLSLSTLVYDDRGQVTLSGQAAPGTVVRAYVNEKMVAEGTSGADGHWRLMPPDPIEQGKHRLRLDRIAKDGKPVARLELPFERVIVAPVSSADGRRLYIVRGDNLWNIARAHYGAGWRHTVIFAANKEQIVDPNLIYPGQVLTLPKVN